MGGHQSSKHIQMAQPNLAAHHSDGYFQRKHSPHRHNDQFRPTLMVPHPLCIDSGSALTGPSVLPRDQSVDLMIPEMDAVNTLSIIPSLPLSPSAHSTASSDLYRTDKCYVDSLSPKPSVSSLTYFHQTDSPPPFNVRSPWNSKTPPPTVVFEVNGSLNGPHCNELMCTVDDQCLGHQHSLDSGDSVEDPIRPHLPHFDRYLIEQRPARQRLNGLGQRSSCVLFDRAIETSNGMKCMVSSAELTRGVHQWEVVVMKCNAEIQELGVIGGAQIERVSFSKHGLMATHGLGTRIVYGCERRKGRVYFASMGRRSKKKLFRDLTDVHQRIGWRTSDVIRIRVNLEKWSIRFWLNGNKVGRQMHLEKDRAYYPVIAFAGDGQYAVH